MPRSISRRAVHALAVAALALAGAGTAQASTLVNVVDNTSDTSAAFSKGVKFEEDDRMAFFFTTGDVGYSLTSISLGLKAEEKTRTWDLLFSLFGLEDGDTLADEPLATSPETVEIEKKAGYYTFSLADDGFVLLPHRAYAILFTALDGKDSFQWLRNGNGHDLETAGGLSFAGFASPHSRHTWREASNWNSVRLQGEAIEPASDVPEPGSLALLAAGLLGLGAARRRSAG